MLFDLNSILGGRRVILASKSPRRQELLKLITEDFDIIPAVGEELIPDGTSADDASRILSEQKCNEVAEKHPDALVIGCDTTVVLGGEIFGKPRDASDAARMLRQLSGSTHKVISGVTVSLRGVSKSFSQTTEVSFRELTDEDIAAYIATGEPMDKAGAYGIQEKGCLLVSSIRGDFFNVVGLPVSELAQLLITMLGGDS